ncbi:hypothetical protein HS088_TW04G00580 [Tripterygium wilfordii]|uniref:Uncharacterized protein n=1 Tax=Tripterygium wilfordii TaxID=458696 RepID=A0A7J7DQE7_TRIWF|nr:hypothetical protein HS088_TW04G00580 [Tripterygium wilfordii]
MEQEQLSTEIVNQGIKDSGPNAGSLSFSVRVRRGLPDFLSSVNLKYVKLGYLYLLTHRYYFLVSPIVTAIFIAQLGKLAWQEIFPKCDIADAFFMIG